MNKKRIIFSIFGVLVLVGGLTAGLILMQRNQDIREKAAPASSLSILPSSQIKNPGQSVNFSVKIDTGANNVTGVDIQIKFNPSAIQITQIQPTSALSSFTNVIKNQIDNTAGKAYFAAFTLDSSRALNGNFDILNISGTIPNSAADGSYQIGFDPATLASATNEGVNVIIAMTPGSVNVAASGGSTPTPTPVSTPTPIGTATPTAAPTKTATPAATSQPELPDDLPVSGVSFPFILTVGLSTFMILGSLFLLML